MNRLSVVLICTSLGVALLTGCQGPEGFHLRADAGRLVGTAGNAGGAGTGVLSGAAGTGGTPGSGAGGNVPIDTAGSTGSTAGTTGSTAGSTGSTAGSTGSTAGTTGSSGGRDGGGAGTTGSTAGTTGSSGGRDGGTGGPTADAAAEKGPSQPYSSTNWKATAFITAGGVADLPPNAFDGKLGTRWTTGRNQQGDEWFRVDLGAAMPVSQVIVDDTTHPVDFPVKYELEVSTNDTTYTRVAMGAGAATTRIQFTQTSARYLRIKQTGMTAAPAGSWWSIDELTVLP
jgi:F5/8 type C domain